MRFYEACAATGGACGSDVTVLKDKANLAYPFLAEQFGNIDQPPSSQTTRFTGETLDVVHAACAGGFDFN